MMISTEEVLEAIDHAKRNQCEAFVLVIPVSKAVLAESSMTPDKIFSSVKQACEARLKECLLS